MRAARLVAAWLGLGLVAALPHAAAAGEPLPEDVRQRAEDAFVVGGLEALGPILGRGTESVDAEPLAIAGLYWRLAADADNPSSSGISSSFYTLWLRSRVPEGAQDLSSRRILWVRHYRMGRVDLGAAGDLARAGYPLPAAPGEDPYPRLTALVLDRLRRESLGSTGLPDGGPLKAFDSDPAISWFLESVARPALLGPQPGDSTPEERAKEQEAVDERQALADRNLLLGVGGIAALLALAAVLAAVARPRRSVPEPP